MKGIRAAIIATILTCLILVSCAYALPAVAEVKQRELYPKLTIVVEREQIGNTGLWVIYCQDRNGYVWTFIDDKGEWNVGDVANLLMQKSNESAEEDEIIEVSWEGYIENINDIPNIIEW